MSLLVSNVVNSIDNNDDGVDAFNKIMSMMIINNYNSTHIYTHNKQYTQINNREEPKNLHKVQLQETHAYSYTQAESKVIVCGDIRTLMGGREL